MDQLQLAYEFAVATTQGVLSTDDGFFAQVGDDATAVIWAKRVEEFFPGVKATPRGAQVKVVKR